MRQFCYKMRQLLQNATVQGSFMFSIPLANVLLSHNLYLRYFLIPENISTSHIKSLRDNNKTLKSGLSIEKV